MSADSAQLWDEAMKIWTSGGWLMLPLLILTVFIYYTGLELFIRLQTHFLLWNRVDRMSDAQIATRSQSDLPQLRQLLIEDAADPGEVKRHFVEVANEYLPVINRRIRFLSVIITLGPLMGLLGTVSGMLSTFEGLYRANGDKFQNVVHGISEALITTQTGLVVSIPALVLLSLIIQRRNRLRGAIARLERYNTCKILKVGCPIASLRPQAVPPRLPALAT